MAAAIPPKVSKWFDVGVSIGAAVVIFGALQKILHTEYADIMLKIGLTCESLIFLGYGYLYIKYPAIDDLEVHLPKGAGETQNPALRAMDKMLKDADITPITLSALGDNFKKLHGTVSNMNNISDAVAATGDYTAKTKEATGALSLVKDAYTNAASSMASFNSASESTKIFHEQVQVLTKNLSSLNTIYELELQESNNHLKALNQFYGKLAEVSSVMINSADDATRAKDQIAALSNNLTKLNQVYGNMLTAMQGR